MRLLASNRLASLPAELKDLPSLTELTLSDNNIRSLDKETADKAFPTKPPYSPYAGRNFPTRPYFGDTHTHTSYSMDAGAFGARLGPRDAYRFAKGEEVTLILTRGKKTIVRKDVKVKPKKKKGKK